MEYISSKDNPNIKLFQKLSESKKYRTQYGMFVLEGIRLCTDAATENNINILMITEDANEKFGSSLQKIIDKSEKTIYISNELGKKLSDTGTTQGVFCICNILDKIQLTSKIKNNGRYIVLDNLQDPGNVGTIIRTADAVGIDAIIMCGCCDIYNPKVIRSTMGSVFRIPIIIDSIDNVIDIFNKTNIITYASVVDDTAEELTSCDFSKSCAVVIGNEGNGLSQETVNKCKHKLTIRMKGNVNSLNAAMAAGIIMWEMLR